MLSPGQIAPPMRHVVRRSRNIDVELAEVTGFDLDAAIVHATGARRRRAARVALRQPDRRRRRRASRTSATTSSPGTRRA